MKEEEWQMNEIEMIIRTQIIVEKIGTGTTESIPFCSKAANWQINMFYEKGVPHKLLQKKLCIHFNKKCRVEHGHYNVQVMDSHVCVVYGNFYIRDDEADIGGQGFPYEITVIMKSGIAERIILYGNRDEPILCMIRSDEDHLYMLRESEILYIESNHNNLIWHCRNGEVKGRGTLKRLEALLPKNFFRLQRGYIVNFNHIKSLEQRELVIDNGDLLLIPVRSYYEIKRHIQELYAEEHFF